MKNLDLPNIHSKKNFNLHKIIDAQSSKFIFDYVLFKINCDKSLATFKFLCIG